MAAITEDHLEQQAIEWFQEIGYSHAFGPELTPDGSLAERADYRQLVLQSRLRSALRRLNPEVPPATIDRRCCSSATRMCRG
jgi:type I restriction enzyme R subunit